MAHGVHQRPVGPGVSVHDFHPRQALAPGDVKGRGGGMPAQRGAVEHHLPIGIGIPQKPQFVGPESLHPESVGFGDIAGGMDFVVQHRKHAHPPGVGRGGDAHGVQQVQVGIGADRRRRAHRPGHHHGFGGFYRKVQKIGRFLQSGRAVSHRHPRQIAAAVQQPVDPPRQGQPLRRANGGAAYAYQILGRHRRDALDFGHPLQRLRDGKMVADFRI